jgi:hypothetical protein
VVCALGGGGGLKTEGRPGVEVEDIIRLSDLKVIQAAQDVRFKRHPQPDADSREVAHPSTILLLDEIPRCGESLSAHPSDKHTWVLEHII